MRPERKTDSWESAYKGVISEFDSNHAAGSSEENDEVFCRKGHGLRHQVALRNIVQNEGVEILYDLYSPIILEIQVLRLQKRLDSDLRYLRSVHPQK